MITPFKDNGRLTPEKRHFNRVISSARQVVERSIGHLKGRFRRLRDIYSYDIGEVCKLIMAACVLHNLCVLCDDEIAEFFYENIENNARVNNYPPVNARTAAGVQRRNMLVAHLQHFR